MNKLKPALQGILAALALYALLLTGFLLTGNM